MADTIVTERTNANQASRDIPIIFIAPMVRALLDGRKTQTRRIMKPQPVPFAVDDAGTMCDVGLMHLEGDPTPRVWIGNAGTGVLTEQKVRYAVGDLLWVRECWSDQDCCEGEAMYRATAYGDGLLPEEVAETRWRPSIHMPRWASRITLIVEGVKVEQLQDISEADAVAEGIEFCSPRPAGLMGWRDYGDKPGDTTRRYFSDPRKSFQSLWNSINGADAWDANPFVVAISFRVERANIDALRKAGGNANG